MIEPIEMTPERAHLLETVEAKWAAQVSANVPRRYRKKTDERVAGEMAMDAPFRRLPNATLAIMAEWTYETWSRFFGMSHVRPDEIGLELWISHMLANPELVGPHGVRIKLVGPGDPDHRDIGTPLLDALRGPRPSRPRRKGGAR